MSFRDLVPWGQGSVPARREPLHPFEALQDRMNRMFEDFFQGWGPQGLQGLQGWGAQRGIQMEDDEHEVRLTADLPGLSEKDIDVRLSGDTLTIQGRKEETDESGGRRQSSFRSVHQQVQVPGGIDREQIRATLKDGVLTLVMPKTEEAKKSTKRIEVSSE